MHYQLKGLDTEFVDNSLKGDVWLATIKTMVLFSLEFVAMTEFAIQQGLKFDIFNEVIVKISRTKYIIIKKLSN